MTEFLLMLRNIIVFVALALPGFILVIGASPLEIKGWIIDSAQTTSHFNVLKCETGCNPSLQRIDKYAPLYYVDENTRFTKMYSFVNAYF